VAVAATKKTLLADFPVAKGKTKEPQGSFFHACAASSPQSALPLAFSAKVWRIMGQRGFPRLKFAVIRQFRAESVIEISWLRFRDSIAFSMCF
jgi:hypothetical protein